MRMITACFAYALQRWTSRLCVHFLLTFQEVTPISKTRNQLILSVKSGRQKPINRKSQNVFDFIEINGLSCAQVIEIIEH